MTPVTCRHFGDCGGCSLPLAPYDAQIDRKTAALRERLGPFLAGMPDAAVRASGPVFVPVAQADGPSHFRQKVAFVFGTAPDGRGLVMGHYARGSQRVVPVDECPVHSARGNRIAFALRDRLARAGIRAAGPGGSGVLRHLIVRTTADDRQAVAMLVVTRNDKALRAPVRALLASADRPDGLLVNVHDGPGPFMVGPDTLRVGGLGHVRESIGGLSFLVAPTAFFQTNVRAAAVLQQLVVEAVAGAGLVLDLYCGSGLLSLPLAAAGARVVGIEENPQAVRDAEGNRRVNRIDPARVRFVAGRVERVLPGLVPEPWDAVILDPPRQGCPDEVLRAVFRGLAPARAVYVSCNPEALAAELPRVLEAGYRATALRAVDMFPHTDHVEAVLTLERNAPRRDAGAARPRRGGGRAGGRPLKDVRR